MRAPKAKKPLGLVRMPEGVPLWPVDKLQPYVNNPRVHAEDEVRALAAMMLRRGWTNPIQVDLKEGTVLAGHLRLRAALHLGLKEVPVVDVSYLSDLEKRALVVADNAIALKAEWDQDLLDKELAAMEEAGMDLDLVGFTPEDLEGMGEGGEEQATGTQAAPQGQAEDRGGGGLGTPVVSYTLVFDDEEQQTIFFDFLRWLKRRRGDDGSTIGARVAEFIHWAMEKHATD